MLPRLLEKLSKGWPSTCHETSWLSRGVRGRIMPQALA